VFSTDIYKIAGSDSDSVCFERATFPRVITFAVLGVFFAWVIWFVWRNEHLEVWFWFASIGLALMIYGLLYALVPDKRIILEDDGSTFVLTGKHWFGSGNRRFASQGVMTVVRVVATGGNSAMNYILEIKTLDGLRFMLGFHTYGSFKKEKLEELGELLEERSRGRLALTR
jgi:hypothetical protein